MPEKRTLTESFIRELSPPEKGERWISDMELPGFGVRLWGGRTSGKSYAIRITVKGKTYRRAIMPAYKGFLEDARDKAFNIISEIEDQLDPIKEMSLEALASYALKHQRKSKTSQKYQDDNEKRFHVYTSDQLKQKKAIHISAQELIDELNAIQDKPGQRQNLCSFYRYMYRLANTHTCGRRPRFLEIKNGIN